MHFGKCGDGVGCKQDKKYNGLSQILSVESSYYRPRGLISGDILLHCLTQYRVIRESFPLYSNRMKEKRSIKIRH